MPGRSSGDVAGLLKSQFPGLRVTSADRTPQQQQALIAARKTRATNSQHLAGTALDIVLPDSVQSTQVANFLRSQGVNPTEFLNESGRGRNQGTGPHLHIGWGAKEAGAPQTGLAAPQQSTYARVRATRQADDDRRWRRCTPLTAAAACHPSRRLNSSTM